MSAHRYHRSIESPRPLSPEGPFGLFADQLLADELPELPEERRAETIVFISRRANQVPTPLRLGITTLAIGLGLAQHRVGVEKTTQFLTRTSLPLVSELARMVRSLGFAYIWETWPHTSSVGGTEGDHPEAGS